MVENLGENSSLDTKKAETASEEEGFENNSLKKRSYIVGVGASAGGLEALESFFENMRPDSGLSFVVIQHLSPDYKSLMVELLSKRTKMNVVRVENGMLCEPNVIYLIPPKSNMSIFHRKLLLTEQDHDHGINLPIDIFFRSLAEDQADTAVGVVLSGTGSDGMRGVRAIKEAGGMVMVQDEVTAKFDGMPRSAISTGLVDFVVPPEKMGEQLLNFIEHPHISMAGKDDGLVVSEDHLVNIAALVRKQTGLDLTYYKPNTVVRRIDRRLHVNQIDSLQDYVRYLSNTPREIASLYKEILIGVTSFFRDEEAFRVLKEKVIAEIFENTKREKKIRGWVAGCSTGEEAYSIAIIFNEYAETLDEEYDIKIFATDIDKESIEFASNGIYLESITSEISPDYIAKYFIKQGNHFQVSRKIREMVIFAPHNIIKDPPFTRIDFLSCRNLLIYLQQSMQRKILSLFSFSLKTNGILFLGTSESVGEFIDQFHVIDSRWKIFRNRTDRRPPLADAIHMNPVKERRQPVTSQGTFSGDSRALDRAVTLSPVLHSLFDDMLSPALVVDDNNNIIHILGNVDNYLRFQSGDPSLKLSKLIRKELVMPAETALHRAGKEMKEVLYQDIKIDGKESRQTVSIRVRPITVRKGQEILYLLFFEEKEKKESTSNNIEKLDVAESTEQRISDLEQELQYTRENLQATIEELETSNEELQATNEELIASNEELQSTNEELQSVNEELYTVNAEYQLKIQELTDLNNDMDNLLQSTKIGTLFLDEDLCIRKFTPAVSNFIHVLERDVGRPIGHLTLNANIENLPEDVRRVQHNKENIEKTLETNDGRWILIRITPYEAENSISRDDVVITFVDISELHQAETELKSERDLLSMIMETTPLAVTMVDVDGRITFANKNAEELFGLTKDEISDRTYNDPRWKITDCNGNELDEEQLPFSIVKKEKKKLLNFKHCIVSEDGEVIHLSISSGPLFDEDGEFKGMVSAIRNVTEEMDSDSRLYFKRLLIDNLQCYLFSVGLDGKIVNWNNMLQNLTGYAKNDITDKPLETFLGTAKESKELSTVLDEITKKKKHVKNEYNITCADGSEKTIELTAHPITAENGEVQGILFSNCSRVGE